MATTTLSPAPHAYTFRAQAADCSDNTSPFAGGLPVRITATQDSNRSITYRGTWRHVALSRAYGGSVRRTTVTGASATLHFTGRTVAWIASVGPRYGGARVIIDGRTIATIHLRATTNGRRRVVYTKAWPTDATHSIRIIALGTSGHPLVDVDALITIR